jgi:hypothetical protein
MPRSSRVWVALSVACVCLPSVSFAADRFIAAGGDLQAAINAAAGGDRILLEPGATFIGNFRLPPHAGTTYVTIRSAASDTALPAPGTRVSPASAATFPKIKSPNSEPAIEAIAGAGYWRLETLELLPTFHGLYDIVAFGTSGATQTTTASVPHHLVADRLYIHGDALEGQKRGIALNSADTTVSNCYISDIKAIGQDSQALGGWNGPGPFTIENNYLEAAGEVILFGGAAPSLTDLVPSNIVIRGNTITRPLRWRDPILRAPTSPRGSAAAGAGSLPAGQYGYSIVARRGGYDSIAVSNPSAEVTVTLGSPGRAMLSWDPVPDAADYVVYGRGPGNPTEWWVTAGTSFVDDGASPATPGSPSRGTVWSVKNLTEFKNGRHILVTNNVFQHNWAESQTGVAILFTPRAEGGACNWCVVEDITFEYNAVRSAGAGINILGIDDYTPSLQTNNIRIRHNEFTDISQSWGGTGYFLQLIGQPRDITIDHNTIIAPIGGGVIQVEGPPVLNFVFTNNVARHNYYGVIGTGHAPGMDTINTFFPGIVMSRNVFAGGDASLFPATNLFPSTSSFEGHFADYAAGKFSLNPGTDWERAGTDGLDLGAVFDRRLLPEVSTGRLNAPRNIRIGH